jgi:hypothetical protein
MTAVDPIDFPDPPIGPALCFGGARYLQVDPRDFPNRHFTVSFWVRMNGPGMAFAFGADAVTGVPGLVNGRLRIWLNQNSVEVRLSGGGVGTNTVSLSDGREHHVAVTFLAPEGQAGQVQLAIFVDGVKAKADNWTWQDAMGQPITLGGGPLWIGVQPPENNDEDRIIATSIFDGHLADFRIWSRVLSDGEIADDALSTVFGLEPDLYLALPLDFDHYDRAANAARDLTPARRNAHAIVITENGAPCVGGVSSFPFPAGDRTIELWLRCGWDAGGSTLLSYANTTDNPQGTPWLLQLSGPNSLSIGGYGYALGSDTNLMDGEWHHLAVCATADQNTVYVDGIANPGQPGQNTGQVPHQLLLIGSRYPTGGDDEMFTGELWNLAVWQSIRKAGEVKLDAWGDFDLVDDGNLVAAWSFNPQGAGWSASAPGLYLGATRWSADPTTPQATGALRPKRSLLLAPGQVLTSQATGAALLATQDFTVVVLVKAPAGKGLLLSRLDQRSDGPHGFELWLPGNRVVIMREYAGASYRTTQANGAVDFGDNNRHSLAFVRQGQQTRLYIDGQLVSAQSSTSPDNPPALDLSSSAPFRLGGQSAVTPDAGGDFAGELLMAGVWTRALRARDIQRAAFGLIDTLYDDMLAYWAFDGTLDDESDQGFDLLPNALVRFVPALRENWAQDAGLYRFLHIEGQAQRARDALRRVTAVRHVAVPAGAALLYGALSGGSSLAPPEGVQVKITDPNGNLFLTEQTTATLLVRRQGASLLALIVKDPAPGRWQVEVSAEAQHEFAFQLHVLPPQDVPAAMSGSLDPLYQWSDDPGGEAGGEAGGNAARALPTVRTTLITSIGFGALAVIATLLAPELALPALAMGLVANVTGAATALVQMFVAGLDRSNLQTAAYQSQAFTNQARTGALATAGSDFEVRQVAVPPYPPDGPTTVAVDFDVPATTTSLSVHVYTPEAPKTGTRTQISGPDGALSLDEFMTMPGQLIAPALGLRRGYAGVIVPNRPLPGPALAGKWTVTLAPGPKVKEGTQLRVCLRQRAAGVAAPARFILPLKFFTLFRQDKSFALVDKAFKGRFLQGIGELQSIYQQANITIQCEQNATVLQAGLAPALDDVFVEPFAEALRANAQPQAINVVFVSSLRIDAGTVEGSARGFSMLPGPQGFLSPFSFVMVTVKPSKPDEWFVLAHELGHCLGLTHTSACLGVAGSTLDDCNDVVGEASPPSGPLADAVAQNVMHHATPGRVLNADQIGALQQAPILIPVFA